MAHKTDSPDSAGDNPGKPARLPRNVHARAAALAAAIRVRKARGGTANGHKGTPRPALANS
jgi:hypothetical protein